MAPIAFPASRRRAMTLQPADWLGWAASAVLLATLARQVIVQWREESTQGVSSWLFVGQLTASVGFAIYSWLVHNGCSCSPTARCC